MNENNQASLNNPPKEKNPVSNFKIVIRLLPSDLSENDFFTQLKNYYPKLDEIIVSKYYVQGHLTESFYEKPVYSRAYLYFKKRNFFQDFMAHVKDKKFYDENKNVCLTTVIERVLYNKIHNESHENPSLSSIENNIYYKKFLMFLKNELSDFDITAIKKEQKKKDKSKSKSNKDSVKASLAQQKDPLKKSKSPKSSLEKTEKKDHLVKKKNIMIKKKPVKIDQNPQNRSP